MQFVADFDWEGAQIWAHRGKPQKLVQFLPG
jgi:hypothetical protein